MEQLFLKINIYSCFAGGYTPAPEESDGAKA